MSASTTSSQQTPQRQTALTLIHAFNAMDIPLILSLRAPSCVRQIVPHSLHIPPSSNDSFAAHLRFLVPAFRNFTLTLHDLVEDVLARKIVMWLTARADTAAGEYVNEYVWTLEFGEGEEEGKILQQREFVDTVVNKEFYPKLMNALKGGDEKGE